MYDLNFNMECVIIFKLAQVTNNHKILPLGSYFQRSKY